LKARGIVVKLLIAGSGDLTEMLKEQAESLGVVVQFTGFLNQSEMWKAYLPADAFVLPSTSAETWGLVTNEAMLFGLPVIVSSQVGCAEDLVIEGKTGLTFNGGAEELADAMIKLYANRKWAANLGLAGRERIVRYFSTPVATAGLLAAVRYVLEKHAANGN
jgi:glycosyltransferase involved in cell wall biosynthesis